MPNGGDPGDSHEIAARFDAAMMEIYERAGAEVGYWATRYLQMLRRRGGLDAYTAGLAREAKARKAAEPVHAAPESPDPTIEVSTADV